MILLHQVGFKMFLGVTASVSNWDADGTCCSIVLEDNPLVDFVELPDTCQGLYYCNVLSGVIRGALEMVSNISSYWTALTLSSYCFLFPSTLLYHITDILSRVNAFKNWFLLLWILQLTCSPLKLLILIHLKYRLHEAWKLAYWWLYWFKVVWSN